MSAGAGDFTSFRRALLRPLPGEQAISGWRPASGDLGLQVLEWWAYLADVLTFYNARYADESYLGTATQPGSIANLVALLGYQPGPGTAATGVVAVVSSPGPAAGPLVIPEGMSMSSTASPGVPAQTFKAGRAMTFTGSSAVPVALPPVTTLVQYGDGAPQSVLIAGRVSGVTVGDRLVLADRSFAGEDDGWSLVTVASLTPATDPATGAPSTSVGFAPGGWGPTPPPGYTAATAPSTDSTQYRLLRPASTAAIINPAALAAPKRPPRGDHPIEFSGEPPRVRQVHLSAAVRDISPGNLVLFDRGVGNPSALAVVTCTSEALWAIPSPASRPARSATGAAAPSPPDIVVAHTVLDLDLADADSDVLRSARDADALGAVTVRYGFGDIGTIIGVPLSELKGTSSPVSTAYTPPAAGATAFLQDATGAGAQVTVTVNNSPPGNATVEETATAPSAPPPPASLAVPLTLLLNLVPVSRGTTVTGEVLGSGNAALARQSFTLAKSPLTYLPGGSGPVSTLTVTVNQVAWHEVRSFFGQAASARVFVVTRSPDQTVTTVTFGDGVNGARLPSGPGNVVASYRYGSGAASPPAGCLTTISQPQLNLASIQNPVPIPAGTDPQAPGDVRTAAPASVITSGRAISAADFEAIAVRAPGVSRAAVSLASGPAGRRAPVTVYVDGNQAAVTAAAAALAEAGDPNRRVVVTAATAIELSLSAGLAVSAGQDASAVQAAATAAVSAAADGLFSSARMGIGQPLYRSAIDAALMVPGVAAVQALEVTGAGYVLGEVLDPGAGAYFDLSSLTITTEAVSTGG